MSLLKANAVQLGQSITATNNFTWYQPASPDGTVRLGNGNSGSVTDLITVGSTGNLTFTGTTETYTNSVTISAASTRTLTLNGGAGSNGLVLDASNNVGVGTASPTVLRQKNLEVSSSGTNDGAAVIVGKRGTGIATVRLTGLDTTVGTDINFNFPNTGDFSFFDRAASATRLTLDSSGNLGIGTTGPSKKLEVFVSANSLQIESIVRNDQAGSGIAAIGFNVSSSAAAETTSTKAGIGLVRQNAYGCGSLCFYNSVTTSAGDFTTADERARIDTSGNLLVGNTVFANGGKMLSYATSAYNANTYNPLELGSASGATVNHQLQKTTVSTSATVILSTGLYGSFVVVFGSDGTNRFIDLVLFGLGNGAVGVVSSFSVAGLPAARTYSQSSSTYRLAMASGTYTVQAYALSMNG